MTLTGSHTTYSQTAYSPAMYRPARPGIGTTTECLERELTKRWPPGAERVHQISRYALLPAGKLLRPLLLLESARAVGGERGELVSAALAVEYLHVGSLLHDDVIDSDETRRGRPSVPARYGMADAIVAGDALILKMFSALTECVDHGVPADAVVTAVQVLATAGIDLCRGQAMEAELCGDLSCGLDGYLTMIGLKTGALFRGACQSGAVLGGGSPASVQAITRYAEHLGLAFQMHDDVLAYTGTTEVTGKSGISDVANRRPTFPVLLGYQMAGAADRGRISSALTGGLPERQAYELMRDVLHATGALKLADQRAEARIDAAKECLAELSVTGGAAASVTDSAAALAAIADLAVRRDR